MRGPARVAAALLLLLALAAAAAALSLRARAGDPALRARLLASAARVLGREPELGAVELALLPPRLVLHGLRLPAAAPEDALVAEAERAELPLAPWPLALGRLVPAGLVLHGGRAQLAHAEASPPASLALEAIELRARPRAGGVIELELSARVAAGGGVALRGSIVPDSALAGELTLDRVAVGGALPYLGALRALAGTVSGTLRASGPVSHPALVAELALDAGELVLPELRVVGAIGLRAELDGWPPRAAGRFEIDASGAELAWGEAYRKPVGTFAAAEGRLVPQPGAHYVVADLHVRLREFRAQTSPRAHPAAAELAR